MKSTRSKALIFIVTIALLVIAVFVIRRARPKNAHYLERAEAFYRDGKYDAARIEYLNLLRVDRSNATGIMRLGAIWFASGDPLEAARYLSTASSLVPHDLETRSKLARSYLSIGLRPEARKEAAAILEQSPGHEEGTQIFAETATTSEEVEETRKEIEARNDSDKAPVRLALATLLLAERKFDAFEAELGKVIEADPKLALAHVAIANLYWSKGDLDGAGKEFKAAAELVGPRSQMRIKYAEFYAKIRKTEDAKGLLKEIAGEAPDFLSPWILLAEIALDEAKYDEALDFLSNVFSRNRENFAARMLQASVWLARGETEKAEAGFEALDKEQGNFAPLKYNLARAYVRNNKTNQAIGVLEQAIGINPDFLEPHLLLAALNLRRGAAGTVVPAMQALLKKRPELIQSELLLIQAYRSLARLDDAEVILRRQIAAFPENPAFRSLLGVVLREKKNPTEAMASFEEAYKQAPEDTFNLGQIIEIDLAAKRYEPALNRIRAEIQKTPQSSGLYVLEGRVHAAQAAWDLAEKALQKALELNPDDTGASELLVSVHLATGKTGPAIELLNRTISKKPNDIAALTVLALVSEQVRDNAKARTAYEKILSLQPENAAILNNLAYLYLTRFDDAEKAASLARKARALNPADAGATDTLGWALVKQKDYAQALPLLRESAGKLVGNAEAQFHFGVASYLMGEFGDAKAAFEKASKSKDGFVGKEEIERCMEVIGSSADSAPKSIDIIEAIAKQHPEDPILWLRLGEAHEKAGQHAKAAASYEEASKQNPMLFPALLKLAVLNAGPLNDSAKALKLAKKAREIRGADAFSWELGDILFKSGDLASAYTLFQDAAGKHPEDVRIQNSLAWAAYSMSQLDQARDIMSRIQADPNSPQGKDARTFIEMLDLERSPATLPDKEAAVVALLKQSPDYVPALMVRALFSAQRGDGKAAAADYNEVLRRFPGFAPAQKRLAAVYASAPETRQAAYDLAVRARKILQDDPDLAITLAELSYHRGEHPYAIQLLTESAKKKPLQSKALFFLGMSYVATKDNARGREALDKAVAAGLEAALAAEAAKTLADLPPK